MADGIYGGQASGSADGNRSIEAEVVDPWAYHSAFRGAPPAEIEACWSVHSTLEAARIAAVEPDQPEAVEANPEIIEPSNATDDVVRIGSLTLLASTVPPPGLPRRRRLRPSPVQSATAPTRSEASPLRPKPIPTVDEDGQPLSAGDIARQAEAERDRIISTGRTMPYLGGWNTRPTAEEVAAAERRLQTHRGPFVSDIDRW